MRHLLVPGILALTLCACDSTEAPANAAAAKSESQPAARAEPPSTKAGEAKPKAKAAAAAPKVEPEPEPANPYAKIGVEEGKRVLEARGYKIGKTTETDNGDSIGVSFEAGGKTGALVFHNNTADAPALAKIENAMSSAVLAGPDRSITVRMLDQAEERKAILADLAKAGA